MCVAYIKELMLLQLLNLTCLRLILDILTCILTLVISTCVCMCVCVCRYKEVLFGDISAVCAFKRVYYLQQLLIATVSFYIRVVIHTAIAAPVDVFTRILSLSRASMRG